MDLKLPEVAKLLNVSESMLTEWLQEGKIPSYTLDGEPRFSRDEIETWMMTHTPKNSPFSQKASTESSPGGQKQFGLFRALHKGGIFSDLQSETKEALISHNSKYIASLFDRDADILSEMLLDREKLQSTALGNGIAVPHTRDFLMRDHPDSVTLVFPKRPLEWGALDNKPVFACFFLFASDDARHLHLLAKIAYLSSQPGALELLAQRPSSEQFLDYVKSWESNVKQN